jgi:putative transposase
MDVGRHCTADDVAIIERLVAERGVPQHLHMDNGPELIAWALRDWRMHHTTTSYIEPGAPWENPFVESFNGRARDELLNIEEFGTLLEAQVVIEAWRVESTPTDPTRPSAVSPPPSTPSGGPSTNQRSYDSWTTQRSPVTVHSLQGLLLPLAIPNDGCRSAPVPAVPIPYTPTP